MVAVGAEGCDKVGRVVVESVVPGDSEKEVLLDIFLLGAPDLLTVFVDDGILMWVVGNGGGTRRGGEEMREEFSFWGDGKREVEEDGSRWGG
jgi:hypothetical protein